MEHLLRLVDVLNEAAHTPDECELLFLGLTLVDQPDANAVIQKRQLAQTLAENLIVEVDVLEDFIVCHEVHFGSALFCLACDRHWRHFNTLLLFDDAVLHRAANELKVMNLSVATHGQAQPFRERVDARHAHAMQAA